MAVSLNRQTASVAPAPPERIVQFGGGNFLRGFVDWMVEILNQRAGFDAGVAIVKLTPQGSYAEIDAQDGLFHVRLHGLEDGELVTQTTLVTCVSRTLNPYDDYDAFLALARQPEMRFVVSNSTESGIVFRADDRAARVPSTFPGKLTALLAARYAHFNGDPQRGMIILPCELIEANGDQLQAAALQYADLWGLGRGFSEWVEQHCAFCNTLVDRIVSGFPQGDATLIFEALVYEDKLLVEGESFHSWVIEAPDAFAEAFANEFPVAQTDLNVKIVADARPYREMKVRILNGAHTALVPPGVMLGLETVREAVEHPALGAYLRDLLFSEIVPTLDDSGGAAFADAVLTRFRNPFIRHRLASIALNSLSKFKARLLPSLLDYTTAQGAPPERIAFAFAALLRFYKGEWDGKPISLNDDPALIAWLGGLWEQGLPAADFTAQALANESLWGLDLTAVPGLAERVAAHLDALDAHGVLAALERLNRQERPV